MANTEGPHSHNQGKDEESEAEHDSEHEEAWARLGFPVPQFEDERNAPPIDMDELREQVLNFDDLPEAEKNRIGDLLRFPSWAHAIGDILREKRSDLPPEEPHSHDKGKDEESEAERDRIRKEAWSELGLPPPQYEDESNAPKIDKDKLREMVWNFNNLPKTERDWLIDLCLRFKSFHYTVGDLFREKRGHRGPPNRT